ncbi:MAG: phytoene/squalene synthase family protein [Patescibacteria group bacterium]
MAFEHQIFKQGSNTYYFSSRFFPRVVRRDVLKLYSFIRVTKDYVAQPIADHKSFNDLKKLWEKYSQDTDFSLRHHHEDSINLRVIKNIIYLQRHYKFEHKWIESFFDSMQQTVEKEQFKTLKDTLNYINGSAEVIGLMMARIFGLGKGADHFAKLQARAFQQIYFLRDIEEDFNNGIINFPKDELKQFGLSDLSRVHVTVNPKEFKAFMNFQLERYHKWQAEAEIGHKFVPRRLRIALKTAVDMANWTAAEITTDPFTVYHRKLQPNKNHVVRRSLKHLISPHHLA